MKMLKKILAFILFLLLCYLCYIWIAHVVRQGNIKRDIKIQTNFKIDTCEIVDESYQKGHSVKYEFSFNGKVYDGWYGDYEKQLKRGQLFLVEFDSLDPSNNRIRTDVCYNCK